MSEEGTREVGDNDPAATEHLKARVAAVDIMVPRIERTAGDRPMCWGWHDTAQDDSS